MRTKKTAGWTRKQSRAFWKELGVSPPKSKKDGRRIRAVLDQQLTEQQRASRF